MTFVPFFLLSQAKKDPSLVISCANYKYNRDFPQGGNIPLNQSRSFILPGMPTAIRAYPHDRGLALFVGTANGMLMKVLIIVVRRVEFFLFIFVICYLSRCISMRCNTEKYPKTKSDVIQYNTTQYNQGQCDTIPRNINLMQYSVV